MLDCPATACYAWRDPGKTYFLGVCMPSTADRSESPVTTAYALVSAAGQRAEGALAAYSPRDVLAVLDAIGSIFDAAHNESWGAIIANVEYGHFSSWVSSLVGEVPAWIEPGTAGPTADARRAAQGALSSIAPATIRAVLGACREVDQAAQGDHWGPAYANSEFARIRGALEARAA